MISTYKPYVSEYPGYIHAYPGHDNPIFSHSVGQHLSTPGNTRTIWPNTITRASRYMSRSPSTVRVLESNPALAVPISFRECVGAVYPAPVPLTGTRTLPRSVPGRSNAVIHCSTGRDIPPVIPPRDVVVSIPCPRLCFLAVFVLKTN